MPRDRFLWWGIYPLMAIGSVHIANDNSVRALLSMPSYYFDLLFAFAFVYLTGFYLRFVDKHLQHIVPWRDNRKKRLILQAIVGILFPLVVLLIAESIYLVYGLEIPLAQSSILYLELPVAFIFLVCINLIYYILYLSQQTMPAPMNIQAPKTFIVQKAHRQLPIPDKEIAYFHIVEGVVYMRCLDGQQFVMQDTIEALEKQVSATDFYKLNRQVLASRHGIQLVENTATRKLLIHLNPKHDREVFVSKANASSFLSWWKQTPVST